MPSVRGFPRAFCSWALRVPARRCLQKPLLAKRRFRSSQFPVRTLLRCLLALALPACAICSRLPSAQHPPSSSLMKLTRLDATAEPAWAADTTSASKRSTSSLSRWMALHRTKELSSSLRPTVRTSSTPRCCVPAVLTARLRSAIRT
ncbi:hypothetical protein SDC9_195518 [bioreactor metagenome]|uniref:Uncharacterized protein n=1 Tax=bioreactor metagenome TaxID=1076179 RepID=A0A645IHX5_9ZZZZ